MKKLSKKWRVLVRFNNDIYVLSNIQVTFFGGKHDIIWGTFGGWPAVVLVNFDAFFGRPTNFVSVGPKCHFKW